MGRSINRALNLVALVACLCLYTSVVLVSSKAQSDEITLERKQIFVNILNGPTFSLMVEPDQTVWDLRRDLNELEGIPLVFMETKMGDTLLDLSKKLSDYNISDQSVLSLDIFGYGSPDLVEFTVRTLDGRELPVTTQLDNSVASLKANITQWTGIPQVKQRLLVKSRELKDERLLVHYVGNGTVLDLGRPLEDCRQFVSVFVSTPSGARIELEVNLADTVTGLKEKIWEKAGIPVSVQHISDNVQIIAGEDYLCDLGLETGSTLYMYLYSAQITGLDQVDKLQEPFVTRPVDPYKAPIFREVEDAVKPGVSGRSSLYKDSRNWVVRIGDRPGWSPNLFDPIAHLDPNPDIENSILQYRHYVNIAGNPDASQWYILQAAINRARIKLSSAVRHYRVAAQLDSINDTRQSPGISLGGGSFKQPVPLGADLNNWVPDALGDSDIMRLLEVTERARQVLARDAQTGEGTLSIAAQRRINRAILFTHLSALAGLPPAVVVYDQAQDDEECAICRDDLTVEPAMKLACGHVFHADCIISWATSSYQEELIPGCPSCRQKFTITLEDLGKFELERPDLQVEQDK